MVYAGVIMKTKAAILYELGKPLVVEEIDMPPLGRGQVLVKVLYSGVCRSQLNEIAGNKGEDHYLPHLLGHEGSGMVIDVGPDVTKVKSGDYVVLSWMKGAGHNSSGSKYQKGRAAINAGSVTTFSQYAIISENRMVKIHQDLPPNIAALLGCAVPTGAGIIKNEMKLNGHASLAIFGVGGIGSSALLYAASLGCQTIIAIDLNDNKLAFAQEIGATHIINPSRDDLGDSIRRITGEFGVDYALESSGSQAAMESAFESIKQGGVAVIAGNLIRGKKICLDPFELIKGKKIIGTWGGATNIELDVPYYSQLYLGGHLKIDKLISREYPLDKINQAFNDLEKGGVVRALINCQK